MNLPSNYQLIQHDVIDSTNLEAKRMVQGGHLQSANLVITAKSQSFGKGRLGRNWVSDEGNLFVSVVKRIAGSGLHVGNSNNLPSTIHGAPYALLPFLTAIAIGETLSEFINARPLYKWPNDVLIDGKKISGVLIEVIKGYAVIGIGINIGSFPDGGTKLPATCLNEHFGGHIEVSAVLELLISNLDKKIMCDDTNIIKEWVASAYGIGRNIIVQQGEKEISGVFSGIDDNGRLILLQEKGTSELVSFGYISWI